MECKLSSATTEVIIGPDRPTVLIGEKINPTGKKELSTALQAGNLEPVRRLAKEQVKSGADILDINVGLTSIDEVELLPLAIAAVMETVDVPLCIDSNAPKALEAALKIYQGKPLVNSVNGEERSLSKVLPLVKEYNASVIGLAMDENGIPNDSERRLTIAKKIVLRAEDYGIPRENIIIDCLAMSVGTDAKACLTTLETMRKVKADLGVNITLGASNVSFGLPDRGLINSAFLAIAIATGLNCPIVDPAKTRSIITATDLILGCDAFAQRYTQAFRKRRNDQRNASQDP